MQAALAYNPENDGINGPNGGKDKDGNNSSNSSSSTTAGGSSASSSASSSSSTSGSGAQTPLVPHVNPLGVTVRLHCLPNFSERHLVELQKVLAQNEAFRSNQTTEPCQCPIILDVCSK